MSITLKKISKTFGATQVLSDVSTSFNLGERIALVGENGAGKTTLLRMCASLEEPTTGSVRCDDHKLVCYVAQEFPVADYEGMTGLDYVYQFGADNLVRSVRRLLNEFEVGDHILELQLDSLSGGQQRILDMCTTLARRPHYLLLDEPENHLDIFARQILISMIREYRGCVVFVSHDQEFINAVTNRIVEVVDGTLQSYTGTYEFYLEHKARLEAGAQRTWNAHEKKVEQLDRLIKRMREWVKKNPDLGAQLRARKTQLRHLQEKAPNRPKTHSKMKLGIGEVEQKNTKRMLMSNGLTLKRGDSTILWNTDVYLSFGEKVAIVGRNGSGKTSFLKAVMGEIPITAGELKVGVGADIGYFSQESLAVLDPNKTPLDVISTVMRAPDHQQRALLARYLIGADACTRKISTLSGGQKTRLRFCLLFAAGHDFLLLDEPTNHLDPVSWEILTESLKEFGGTVLLVSHDRMFIDQVAKKLWIVEDTSISEFAGTLSEYLLEG